MKNIKESNHVIPKELYEEIHKIGYELLTEFKRVCEKHELMYFLGEGTLLGAMRHQGIIPWDDDVDVLMPREDFNKLTKIVVDELLPEYEFDYYTTNSHCVAPFGKIRNLKTIYQEEMQPDTAIHKGFWIDIFPLDDVSKREGISNRIRFCLVHLLHHIAVKKETDQKLKFSDRFFLYFLKAIKTRTVLKVCIKIMEVGSCKGKGYFANFGSAYGWDKETFEKKDFFPPHKTKFGGEYYWIPKESAKILEQIYVTPMILPPQEDRVAHKPRKMKF